ncbi:MAG: hypothetical protein ACP5SK_05615, partial [Thermoprotei archaeon]
MQKTHGSIWLDDRFNAISLITYMLLVLLASAFLTNWFPLGDFSFGTVEWYHAVMIPFTLFLMVVAAAAVGLEDKIRAALNLSTYPVIATTLLGIAFVGSPVGTVAEGVRDAWVMFLAVIFDVALLVFPFKERERFKQVFGAYVLLFVASV